LKKVTAFIHARKTTNTQIFLYEYDDDDTLSEDQTVRCKRLIASMEIDAHRIIIYRDEETEIVLERSCSRHGKEARV